MPTQHGQEDVFSRHTVCCYVWLSGATFKPPSDTGRRLWRSAPGPQPPFLVSSRRSLTRLALHTSCTRPTMMGGAEIRVDDGAARARAQRCMSDVLERESREVGKERGADRWVVRVSPCLDGRRVLSQSIHTDSARLLYTRLPYCHLETRPGPQHTHPPRPCASLTLVCDAIIVAI